MSGHSVGVGSIVEVTDPADVEAALEHPSLVPPACPSALGDGPTAALRNSMARFSSGFDHQARRDDVERAIDAVDQDVLGTFCAELTREHMAMREHCDIVADIAFVVPTEALARSLGVPSADVAAVRRDVRSVVGAIGRGEPASAVSDAAAVRLTNRFAEHPGGGVATTSLLYQNHDATAALITAQVVADALTEQRRNALARTVRVADADLDVGTTAVRADDTVHVSLEHPDHEFGAGIHMCPGASLARLIADTVCSTLTSAGWRPDLDRSTFAADGRAVNLPRDYIRTDDS